MADFCAFLRISSHPFIRTFVEARLGGITPRAGHTDYDHLESTLDDLETMI